LSIRFNLFCFRHGIKEEKYFTAQIVAMRKLLNKQHLPSNEEVINVLGHSVNALYSVPTAIYCFLRNSQDDDEKMNSFRRTLEYAINLGGDTDTIASMSCSLAGAFFGDTAIPENLVKHCEGWQEMIELADQLNR